MLYLKGKNIFGFLKKDKKDKLAEEVVSRVAKLQAGVPDSVMSAL